MSEKVIYKKEAILTIPICIVDEEGKETIIEKLELKRIKLKALKDLPPGSLDDGGSSYTSIIPLIAASSGMAIEIVEEIDMIDLSVITEAMEPFLPKSPEIGKN